eukprot:4743660-Pyramimonas_sp.AAC.1
MRGFNRAVNGPQAYNNAFDILRVQVRYALGFLEDPKRVQQVYRATKGHANIVRARASDAAIGL